MAVQMTNRLLVRPTALLVSGALLLALAGCKGKKDVAAISASSGQSQGQSQSQRRSQNTAEIPGLRQTWELHPMEQPGSVFHVEYSPDTSIVDVATVGRMLRGVSEDHSIFLFEDSPELHSKLIPGKFVLFEGLDLRKVDALAVDPKTKNLIVGTERAPLREALKNAQVQFKVPVNFNELFKQQAAEFKHPNVLTPQFALGDSVLYWWNSLNPVVHGDMSNSNMQGEIEISDSDFATWKVHYHFYCPPEDASNLHLDVQLAREANGLNVELSAKGQVSNFIQQTSMLIAQNGVMHFQMSDINLHGIEDFDWTIKSSENKTPMNEVRLKLPGKISIPLAEFELPMSLQISEALLFHPAFTTKDEVAKGSFKVNYSGDEGFKLDGSDVQVERQGEGDSAIDQSFAFSPLASFGLVVAMAVPRIELRMGTEEIWDLAKVPLPESLTESLSDVLLKNTSVGQWLNKKTGNPLSIESAAYFQVVISTTAAHSGMQSLVPCQQFTMIAKGQVGVDAEWLGSNTNMPARDVFTKNLTQRQPDAKICGGG
jgi:hypothetical protein